MENKANIRSSLIKLLWHRIQEDDLPGLSAQLAYNLLFSLFPLIIVIFTLLPYFPIRQEDILGVIEKFAPPEAMQLIEKTVNEVMNVRNGGLLSFGIIGTIWSASTGINAIVVAFNRAYNVKESRSFIVSRGMSILLTFGLIFVFIFAIILPIFGRAIGIFVFTELGQASLFIKLWNALSWIVSAVILFLLFTGLYWIAPNVKFRCRSAIPGAAFATFGWIVSSLGLSYYVGNFSNYSLTYGGIGAIIVLMTWLYISAFIIVLGGEINAFYSERSRTNC
ncbi:YihY/virulence factor BrkB family protein [Bacillus sp. BRMEA1]|uniref:YihY/virulence factor BrkB family protein n=1 Tax=Neobacillus endophyticus TaxID=2738405 RepID=UPI001566B83B|nr:YihY/virulence factor BrkB family protein [Neobacillus endophyticus]NRD78120.1 YihY/virulence factor BrkB family protein [Neobacillus endophyticus]